MTNIEKIIEALEYSKDTDTNWYDVFDSNSEAIKTLNLAKKERIEESNVVTILLLKDKNYFSNCSIQTIIKEILNEMKKELRENS